MVQQLRLIRFCRRPDLDVYLLRFAAAEPLAAEEEEDNANDHDKDDEHRYNRGIAAATTIICHGNQSFASSVVYSYPAGAVVVLAEAGTYGLARDRDAETPP